MNKIFVKTQNVKNFIGLVESLINKPKNIPKWAWFTENPDSENRRQLYGLRASMTEFI